MLIDWRRDDGGVYRVLSDVGIVLGMFTTVEIETTSKLINSGGHGWLMVDGSLTINGDTAMIGK